MPTEFYFKTQYFGFPIFLLFYDYYIISTQVRCSLSC